MNALAHRDAEGDAERAAIQAEAVPPGQSSAEVLERMYRDHGPIHSASYDQTAAMDRATGVNGRRVTLAAEHAPADEAADVSLVDFHAYMPVHQYLFKPTRELWPASSVDAAHQRVAHG